MTQARIAHVVYIVGNLCCQLQFSAENMATNCTWQRNFQRFVYFFVSSNQRIQREMNAIDPSKPLLHFRASRRVLFAVQSMFERQLTFVCVAFGIWKTG